MNIYTLLLVICLSTISANTLFDNDILYNPNLGGQRIAKTNEVDLSKVVEPKIDSNEDYYHGQERDLSFLQPDWNAGTDKLEYEVDSSNIVVRKQVGYNVVHYVRKSDGKVLKVEYLNDRSNRNNKNLREPWQYRLPKIDNK